MFEALKNLFSGGPKVDYAGLVAGGAVIVDVRTPEEYRGGHIRGSLNIPLQNLQGNLSKLKKDKVIITCCASGMRSASAKSLLLRSGFGNVHNGGGWMGLQNRIK
jgi:phage shock protein E